MFRNTFLVASLALSGTLLVSAGNAAEPYPLEYWALRDMVSNVQVSPNGERLALLKIPTRDGNPIVEVYDASDFSRRPFQVNAADGDHRSGTAGSWREVYGIPLNPGLWARAARAERDAAGSVDGLERLK